MDHGVPWATQTFAEGFAVANRLKNTVVHTRVFCMTSSFIVQYTLYSLACTLVKTNAYCSRATRMRPWGVLHRSILQRISWQPFGCFVMLKFKKVNNVTLFTGFIWNRIISYQVIRSNVVMVLLDINHVINLIFFFDEKYTRIEMKPNRLEEWLRNHGVWYVASQLAMSTVIVYHFWHVAMIGLLSNTTSPVGCIGSVMEYFLFRNFCLYY